MRLILPARAAAIARAFRDDERGVGVVLAVSVSVAVFLLGGVWATIATHQVESSSYSRSRDQAVQVAEAGVTEAMSLLSDNPSLSGLQPLKSLVDASGKKYGEYEVTVSAVANPLQRFVQVVGYSPTKTSPTVATRKVEATVEFERPEMFSSALFAYSTDANQPGNVDAGRTLTVVGDIYASGYARWEALSAITGDVSAWGGISSRGTVAGTLQSVGKLPWGCGSGGACGVWVKSGTVSVGNVSSADNALGEGGIVHVVANAGGEPDPVVATNVYAQKAAPTGIVVAGGTSSITGTQWTGFKPPVPVRQEMPTFTWAATNYTPAGVNRTVSEFDRYFDANHNDLGVSGHYQIGIVPPESSGTVKLGGSYCADPGTCPAVAVEAPIVSWRMKDNLTIYTNRPVEISADIENVSTPAKNLMLTVITTYGDSNNGADAVRFTGNVTPPSSITTLVVAPGDRVFSDATVKDVKGAIYGRQIDFSASGGDANFKITGVDLSTCPVMVATCQVPGFTWPVSCYLKTNQIDIREVPV